MKKCMLFVIVLSVSLSVFAQIKIPLATDKTVSLIFPFSIVHVDRGTKDVLAEQVKEQDNILLVKAAVKNFSPTNLSVVATDGTVYSFSLSYQENLTNLIYTIPVQQANSIEVYAKSILDNPRTIKGPRNHSWGINLLITGIYIKENVIYYQLRLTNQSPLDYDIDFLRFYIRDKRKAKRTASQENELTPGYIAGNTRQVKAMRQNTVVVALDKFTIPGGKYLAIEINEKNGGRNLSLKIRNNKIIKAKILPDQQ